MAGPVQTLPGRWEHEILLAALFDFLRDFAVLAAASGIAWWTWDHYRSRLARHDEAARTATAAEREAADRRQSADRLDQRLAGIAARLDEIAAGSCAAEARAATKLLVHRLLHATSDPFLTFVEIERALGKVGRLAGALPDSSNEKAGEEPADADALLAVDGLRRVLIEMVGDSVIAQLNRDRYFIASDYETGDGDDQAGLRED